MCAYFNGCPFRRLSSSLSLSLSPALGLSLSLSQSLSLSLFLSSVRSLAVSLSLSLFVSLFGLLIRINELWCQTTQWSACDGQREELCVQCPSNTDAQHSTCVALIYRRALSWLVMSTFFRVHSLFHELMKQSIKLKLFSFWFHILVIFGETSKRLYDVRGRPIPESTSLVWRRTTTSTTIPDYVIVRSLKFILLIFIVNRKSKLKNNYYLCDETMF